MSGRHQAEADGYAAQYPQDTQDRLRECFQQSSVSDAQQCTVEAITASHDAQRSEQDLNAQRDMAQWAFWLLVISLAQIPLGFLGLMALLASLRQGREGLKIAKDTLTLENRAWLKVVIDQKGIRKVSDGNLNAAIGLTIANVGNSPAIVRGINMRTFLITNKDESPIPKDVKFSSNQNTTLFRDDDLEHGITYYVDLRKVDEALNTGIVPSLGFDIKITYENIIDGTLKECGARYIYFPLDGNPGWLLQEPQPNAGGAIYNYGAMRSSPHDFYT